MRVKERIWIIGRKSERFWISFWPTFGVMLRVGKYQYYFTTKVGYRRESYR